MRKLRVWKGVASQDERGGNQKVVGYYFNRFDADVDVKGQGWWGCDGRVQSDPIEVLEIEVEGKKLVFPMQAAIEVFYENRAKRKADKERLIRNAKAKLTPEELEALLND